jgi:hypothetical protein
VPPLYFGKGAISGCCPGGIGWTGYGRLAPALEFFVSTGTPTFRGGEAEYLKASPDIVRSSKDAAGTITPRNVYGHQATADLDSDRASGVSVSATASRYATCVPWYTSGAPTRSARCWPPGARPARRGLPTPRGWQKKLPRNLRIWDLWTLPATAGSPKI